MADRWRIRQVRETRGVFNPDVALSGPYLWRLDQRATEMVQSTNTVLGGMDPSTIARWDTSGGMRSLRKIRRRAFHLQDKPRPGACGKAPVVLHTCPSHQYGRRIPVSKSLDAGPFFHGTIADMGVGEFLTAGRPSNYRPEIVMNHIYFTALVDGAGLAAEIAAELAGGGAVPRVYQVQPTGAFENDPNVTDKKFPGNPTRSFRSNAPLRIIGEITEWTRLTPEQLQTWRERLSALLSSDRGVIIN